MKEENSFLAEKYSLRKLCWDRTNNYSFRMQLFNRLHPQVRPYLGRGGRQFPEAGQGEGLRLVQHVHDVPEEPLGDAFSLGADVLPERKR